MASIFFTMSVLPLSLQVIALFAMHAEVEALDFLVGGYTNAKQEIHYFQNDESPDKREAPSNRCSYGLIENLPRVPIHPAKRNWLAGRVVSKPCIHGACSEDAREERS